MQVPALTGLEAMLLVEWKVPWLKPKEKHRVYCNSLHRRGPECWLEMKLVLPVVRTTELDEASVALP
jgi:hypothetical protein